VNYTAQETLDFRRPDAIAEAVQDRVGERIVRKSEWVILGFLVYAVGLAALLPVAPSIRHLVTLLNVDILAIYAMLISS
jgi:hypothetical protein